jgi:hypothetical protein
MATVFRDLSEFFDPDLYLPINGKRYRIPAPTKVQADRIRDDVLYNFTLTADEQYAELYKLLGPAYEEMQADKLPDVWITHAAVTAMLHFCAKPEVGAFHWNFGRSAVVSDAVAALFGAEGDA